jgi:hypothetical protein
MAAMLDPQSYLTAVAQRLAQDGFEVTPNVMVGERPADLWAARRKFQATKFGTVSTFVVVSRHQSIDATQLAAYSSACFQAAMERTGGVRGLGSAGVCYAVSVCGQGSPNLASTVETTPLVKHWASFEFPALVDLAATSITYNRQRAIWGAAYIRGFRSAAGKWLQPALSG